MLLFKHTTKLEGSDAPIQHLYDSLCYMVCYMYILYNTTNQRYPTAGMYHDMYSDTV